MFEVVDAAFETAKVLGVVGFLSSTIDVQSLTENDFRFRSVKHDWINWTLATVEK